jgi:CRP-like cAMP-binding protein/predicted GNAT family N-acyltransferase
MTDTVEVREAVSADDREAVYRLRYDVYVEDMHVFGEIADHDRRILTDEHDEDSCLLLATIDDEPQGTMRITYGKSILHEEFEENYDVSRWCPDVVGPDQVMVCSKFAVRPEHRGGVVPFELMRATLEFGMARDNEIVFCDCQPHLVTLYTCLGFRSYRSAYRDAHVASTVPLVLVSRDLKHLAALNSPLLSIGLSGRSPTEATEEILRSFPSDVMAQSAEDGLALLRQLTHPVAAKVRGGSVLEGLSEAELSAVIERGQVLTLDTGDPLIFRGQGTRTLYVVLSGRFDVLGPGGTSIATLTTGAPIGEVAFLLRRERTVDVEAACNGAQVLALSESTLNALIKEQGPIAAKLLHSLAQTLAERLAATYI